MAKQKSKKEIVEMIRDKSIKIGSIGYISKNLKREDLVSALIFIQKAEEILKQK